MKRLIQFVKKNWTDPVWSKVFAAGIIALLSAIGLYIYSLIKQIPFIDIWSKSISFLTTNTFSINYLTILLITFGLLIIIIPMISLKIIRFQLKHLKLPSSLKSHKFDLQTLLKGQWQLVYTFKQNNSVDKEFVTFVNGNQYYINKQLIFVLTDIEFDETKKELKWTKTIYANNQKHSRETLLIVNNNSINGEDDIGYSLNYTKITT
ncbi:MAG: hypothetical protein HOP10_15580 [Chitinophagaceae bacterium]|nr:hypothetical protein [Chitinophagaceae bacterium]